MVHNYVFFSCNYKRKNYFHFYQNIYIYYYKIKKHFNILYIFQKYIYIHIYIVHMINYLIIILNFENSFYKIIEILIFSSFLNYF